MTAILPEPSFGYETGTIQPEQEGYEQILREFKNVTGKPPLTGILLREPLTKHLTQSEFITARYCLEVILAGQRCVTVGYEEIDVETFFVERNNKFSISGREQLHLLAHLVLADLDGLTDQEDVHDRFFDDKEGTILVFSAAFPEDAFQERIITLQHDLDQLLNGGILGRIQKLFYAKAHV